MVGLFSSCGLDIKVLPKIIPSTQVTDTAPVASNFSSSNVDMDTQGIITLIYIDSESHLATTCSVSNLVSLTETQACSCDGAGVCTVGVTGLSAFVGSASFEFSVTANGLTSNLGAVSVGIFNFNTAPVAAAISPAGFAEDIQSVITLSYSDIETDLATACSLSALTNVTVTQACSCDGAGLCTVGVTGTSNYNGAASFNFTVTTNGQVSNSALATLSISAVNDVPVATALTPAAFAEDIQSVITLSYTDVDTDLATSCTLSALTNVTVTQACACTGAGVCTVGVTGTSNYNGAANFNYTVTANGQTSAAVTATLSITAVADAPVASNLIPTSVDEDTETLLTLVYNDAEGDLGSSCSLSNLSNLTVTQACSCSLGLCTVGVTGTANYNGGSGFDYTVTAGGATSNSASVSLTIDPVDDAPTISAIANQTTNSSLAVTGISFTIVDIDDVVTCASDVAGVSSDTDVVANVDIVVAGAAQTCTVDVTPSAHAGVTTITLTVSKNALSNDEDFILNVRGWYQEAYIKAVNNDAGDLFGSNVSLSGDTLAVGAYGESSNQTIITNGTTASGNDTYANSGAVYVYKRSGVNWAQEAYIKAVNNNNNTDYFGWSLSLSGDTLAVGAKYESSNQTSITNGATASFDNSESGSGAVFVYKRSGVNWVQEAYIKAVNGNASNQFGYSVILSGDTLAVSAPHEGSIQTTITNGVSAGANISSKIGAVYVYKRSGVNWEQEAHIKAANGENGDYFGSSLSLSGDTLVVGTIEEASNETTITNGASASGNNDYASSGATYVYKRSGVNWAQEAYIKAVNNNSNSDLFGYSVSLSGDTLAVGATGESSNETTITNGASASFDSTNSASGAVFIYDRSGVNWVQGAYIKAVNNDPADSFGQSVSLSGDTLVVGALYEASNQTTITNGSSASGNNDYSASGATYIYKRTGGNWAPEAYVKAANSDQNDNFGWSVSLSGDTLAVGATGESSNETTITNGPSASSDDSNAASGAVYLYRNNLRLFDPSQFTVTQKSTTSINLSWATAGALAVNYRLAYQAGTTPPANCNSGTLTGNVTSYSVTGLLKTSYYSFRLCAVDGSNNVSSGVTTTISTLSDPPDVGSLNMSSYGSTLNWSAAGGSTTGYRIFYAPGINAAPDCHTGTFVDVGNVTSYHFSGLASGQNYAFRVCSYDVSGNNSFGTVLIASPASGWYQEAYIKSDQDITGSLFGTSVSLSGDRLAVGAAREASGTGATYVYLRSGANWAQEARISASNFDVGDWFGYSVSLSGDTLAVGAFYESSNETTITNGVSASSDNTNNDSGAVYVYKRSGVNWTQEAYIKAANNDTEDWFGSSVSLSGYTLAVGAVQEDSNQTTITNGAVASSDDSNSNSGAVYIYSRSGVNWAQEAYIKAFNNDAQDLFGSSVSLSGETLAVGATDESSNQVTITNGAAASSNNSRKRSGAVYIYKRSGVNWEQEAYIKTVNNSIDDRFGSSVSLSGDKLAVGVWGEDSNETTITNGATASSDDSQRASGAVYLYNRTGSSWAQEAYIKAVNNDRDDYLGYSVSLSGDTLAVGATGEASNETTITNDATASSDNTNTDSGAVYLYTRSGGNWAQEAYIKASNNDAGDSFGSNVSLSGDTLVVGAPYEASNEIIITNGTTASRDNSSFQRGAVYVYRNISRLFDPSQLSVTQKTTTSLNLSWATAGSLAVNYRLAYQAGTTPPANCNSGTLTGNVTSYSVTGLLKTSYYSFRLCAVDGSNNVSSGVTTTISTLPDPPEVSNINITSLFGGYTLNWTAAGGSTTGYEIFYAPGLTSASDCDTGTSVDVGNVTSYNFSGLPPGSNYAFRVCSYDSGGDKSYGSVVIGRPVTGWYQEAYIKSDTINTVRGFGASLSLSWDRLAVGLARDFVGGETYIYSRSGNSWAQEEYLNAINSSADNHFGYSVSLSGDTLAVGAFGEDSNQTTITNGTTASGNVDNISSGAVYVYRRSGINWAQEAYIKAVNNDANDLFGYSVSLSGDTLAVGAPREASNQTTITNGASASGNDDYSSSGAVYVYKRNGVNWAQEAYIKAVNNNNNFAQFGASVSLNGDTLAVGAIDESSNQTSITNGATASMNNSNSLSGAVYIYKRSGVNWAQEAYIKALNNNAAALFGYSVSLNGDRLAVGAINEDSDLTTITNGSGIIENNNSSNSGAVYVYSRSGVNWQQEAYIKAVNNGSGDSFGWSVSLSGNTLAVGAIYEDSNQTTITNGATASSNNDQSESGAVYIYNHNGNSWENEAYIKAVNNNGADNFGMSVSLSGDTLAVGASNESSNQTTITNGPTASADNSNGERGAVYVYRKLSKLFDPADIFYSQNAGQVTFNWQSGGVITTGYALSSAIGVVPASCSLGDTVGNVNTTTTSTLTSTVTYGFRLCSIDAENNLSPGVSFLITID